MNKDLTKAEIREKLAKSPIAFGQYIDPKMYELPTPKFHYELEQLYLDRENNTQVCIQAPRDTAKSSLVAGTFALHHIIYEPGDKFIVLGSKALGHAKRLLGTIKNVLEYSEPFKQTYGYYGRMSSLNTRWNNDEISFQLVRNGKKETVTITTRSASQQVVGLKEGHQRVSFAIWDDPEDNLNTKTKEAMDNNFDVLLKLVPAIDTKRGRLWVIGTPQNSLCMVMKLQNFETWTKRTYRSIINFETKEVLWAEKHSYEFLIAEKNDYERNGNGSMWWSERQCEIVGDEDQLFRAEDMQYWDGSINTENKTLTITHKYGYTQPRQAVEEKTIPVNFFMGIDPASSERATADFTAIVLVAYDADANIYVLPYFRKRAKPSVVRDKVVEYAQRFMPTRSGIETVQAQEVYRDGIKEKMMSMGLHLAGFNRTEGFKPRTEKNERLSSMEIFFADRKIFFMVGANEELIEEFLLHPRSKTDDLKDGLYYATRKLIKPDHNVEVYDTQITEEDMQYYIFNQIPDKNSRYVRA